MPDLSILEPGFPKQDYILLNGVQSPGLISKITGLNSPRRWDERKGYGITTGLAFTSLDLSKFEIEFIMWEPAQYIAWRAFFANVLKPPPKATDTRQVVTAAKAIVHPLINDFGITQVVVEDVLAPEQDEQGLWSVRVRFIEYRPVQPVAVSKPIEGPPGVTPDDKPKSASEVELKEAQHTFKKLSEG